MPYTTLTFINILRIFLCAVSVNWLFIVDLFTLDAFTNRNICKIYPTLNKVGQLIPTTFMSMIFKPEMKLSAKPLELFFCFFHWLTSFLFYFDKFLFGIISALKILT